MHYTSGSSGFFHGRYWPQVYAEQLNAVHNAGDRRTCRGTVSYEMRPTLAIIEDPSARFLVIPGRGLNHCFALAETVSILSSHNSVEYLSFYNANIKGFTTNGVTFDGHYGERLTHCDQLDWAVEELKRDPGSRRAVSMIWVPSFDTRPGSLDYPCNIAVMFKIHNDRLDAHVIRRSSDLLWGVPYDHVVFTTIQAAIAASLRKSIGRMIETTDSLHLYRGLYDDALEHALNATASGKIWAMQNGSPGLGLQETRDTCDFIIQQDMVLRMEPPTMFNVARSAQLQIPDPWWANAWMTMAAYHLWKAKNYRGFLKSLLHVSGSFRSAIFSTFEARIESRSKALGDDFMKEFRQLCDVFGEAVVRQDKPGG